MHFHKQVFLVTSLAVAIALSGFSAQAYEYKISTKDKVIFKNSYAKINNDQYEAAIKDAVRAGNPVIVKIIKWISYQDGYAGANSSEIVKFIDENPRWPNLKTLKNRAEFNLDSNETAKNIIKYFKLTPPVTGYGMRLLAEAIIKNGHGLEQAATLLKQSWQQGDFSQEEEASFLAEHGGLLTKEDHYKRVDRLLWEGSEARAKHLYPFLGSDQKKIVSARLKAMNKHRPTIVQIEESLRNDPGLLYQQIKLESKRKRYDQVYNMLHPIIGTMPYQDKWWKIKNRLIRELLDENKTRQAYYIANNHGNVAGSGDYAEAEWLAGWISLRFLNEPKVAYKHFYNMYNNVGYPVSVARAAYWAGRAAEVSHNYDIAENWFSLAAEHSTTFYGQLAYIKKHGKKSMLVLSKDPKMGVLQKHSEKIRELLNASYILESAGYSVWAERFIKSAITSVKLPSEMAYIGEFGLKVGRVDFSVIAGKEALKKGVVLVKHGWPTTKYMPGEIKIEKPLALSIIRQESLFNPKAMSSAKAMGLMQLIPATAKRMAKNLGLRYVSSRLLSNPKYNITLGSFYLGGLVDRWDGSYILAIASYNAGPGNVKKWVDKYTDPREMKDTYDIIDWIESMPFGETRNYVQRVLENIQVYRSYLGDNSLMIESDLLRGGI